MKSRSVCAASLQEVDVPRLWSELVKAGTVVDGASSGMEVESAGQYTGKIIWQESISSLLPCGP